MGYNLLDEKWIPVLYRDGRWERVGILKVFEDAQIIREIAASNPMDRVAVLRFLIALSQWLGEGSDADWLERLISKRAFFELLGPSPRFYQTPIAQRPRPSTDLLQEVPTGNNFWHFRHATDNIDGLCAGCCAAGLLRLPLFSVGGLPDLRSGINGVPPIYAIACGRTLRDTLMLNWMTDRPLGVPAWVDPTIVPAPGMVVPLLSGLTALSRRVWLHAPSEPAGDCIACGARESSLIRTCEYQTAGSIQNAEWKDPHLLYQEAKDGRALRAMDLTNKYFKMDRPWPSLVAELIGQSSHLYENAPRVFVVGFATDNAKNIDVWERTWEFGKVQPQSTPLRSHLEAWEAGGNKLAASIRARDKFAECTAAITAIRPQIEAQVSASVRGINDNPADSLGRSAAEYAPLLHGIARSLSPGLTTQAVERRCRIAGTLPNTAIRPTKGARKGKK